MNFSFFIGTKVYFGSNCFEDLLKIIQQNQYGKIGIVVDHNLTELSLVQELLHSLGKTTETVIGWVTVSEPTYRYLDEFRTHFMGSGIRCVLGIGGGSTLDAAKAIAVLLNNKEKAVHYRGFNKMTAPVLPVIAVPTTAGTSSEVTPNASFVDDEQMKKMGINGEAIRPKYAFLNPEVLASCPERSAISAGIDALVHAVEAFAARKATPLSDLFSAEAVRLLIKNLEPGIFQRDPQSLESLFFGSLLAGIAMMNSGTGPAAAFSYPLGVHKKVPHGLAGGIFLPRIMSWNIQNGYYGYGRWAHMLFDDTNHASEKENARRVLDCFLDLWRKLKMPSDLSGYGFYGEDIDLFVADIMELKGALDQNPIEIGEAQTRQLLESAIHTIDW